MLYYIKNAFIESKWMHFGKVGSRNDLKGYWLDIKAVQERDPAARSVLEVLLLYQASML